MSTPSSSSFLRNWPCIFFSLHDFTSSSTAPFLYYSGFTGASKSTIIMVWSSPVIFLGILRHVSAAIPQLRDITLSARYGQYQGWLTIVRFQKYLVYSTSHTRRPLHSPRQLQVPIMMGISHSTPGLWILWISRARSWLISLFSPWVWRICYYYYF